MMGTEPRIARPDTRWQPTQTAYAERCMHGAYGHCDQSDIATIAVSWMGELVGQPAESSHPGSGMHRLHAKGGESDRPESFETKEDAGPASHRNRRSDTEEARCANTGLLRRSMDWMSSGTRLDRRQTA